MLLDSKRITNNRALEILGLKLNTIFKARLLNSTTKNIDLEVDNKIVKLRKPKYFTDGIIKEYRKFIFTENGKENFRLIEIFAK